MKNPCDNCVCKNSGQCSCERLGKYELYIETYNQALEDFAEQFKAHCKKFTTKSISDADIDWVRNELKK